MEKSKELQSAEVLGKLGLVILQFGSMFYKVLLAMVTWNLFVANYSFEMGYWQMFLATMVFSLVFGGSFNRLNLEAKINNISGKRAEVKLGLEESYKVVVKTYLLNTLAFVILYGIYLLI